MWSAATFIAYTIESRSQWLRCLRGTAASRFLGLQVRIRRRHGCLSLVSAVFVVRYRSLGGAEHSARGVLASMVCVTECDREASIMRKSWPARGWCTGKNIYSIKNCVIIWELKYTTYCDFYTCGPQTSLQWWLWPFAKKGLDTHALRYHWCTDKLIRPRHE
jgi:hypothetical protein